MANIQIAPNKKTVNISNSGTTNSSRTITLATQGTYVPENIDVVDNIEIIVPAGTLNNVPTSGVTYTANTDASTMLNMDNKKLYINEGYYKATSISLSQLLPDDADHENATSDKIMAGYEAYDPNGNKLIGTVSTIEPTFSGGTVTATAGGSVTTQPKVTVASDGTFKTSTSYGVTTTKPSGTDGTNYLTIKATATPANGNVTATADAERTAVVYAAAATGFVDKAQDTTASAAASATQNTKNISVTPTATNNFTTLYIPVVSPSFAGGDVTATANGSVTTAPSVAPTLGGKITTIASTTKPSTGVDGTNYYSITASGTASNGTVSATADASSANVTYSNAAGAIAAHAASTVASAGKTATQASKDITVTPSVGDAVTYYLAAGSYSASVSTHTISAPTATYSTSVAASDSTSTSGVLRAAPTSGAYLTIAPTISCVDGKSTAKGSASISTAGYIPTGSKNSSNSEKSISVSTTEGDSRYIKIYDNSYTVS